MGKVSNVPIGSIRESEVASLRNASQADNEAFQGLCNSIREKGFLGAISVRAKVDPNSQEPYYELIDGLQRWSAAKYVGLSEIPVNIQDISDDEVLESQILMNIHRVDTSPVEYSKQLQRIINRNPMLSAAALAKRLGKSTQWIDDRLALNKITSDEIREAIKTGAVPLSNAYALAKLPEDEQASWLSRAMTEKAEEFVPAATARVKAVKEAKRAGRNPDAPKTFEPTPRLQKMATILGEIREQANIKKIVEGCTTPEEAGLAVLKWVVKLDPASVQEAIAKEEKRKADVEAAKVQRQKDKEAKAAAAQAAATA